MDSIFTSAGLTGLLALTFMEIMLGIDNVIFVSIILDKVSDPKQRKLATRIWMFAGLFMRLLLLYLLSVVIDGKMVLFSLGTYDVTLEHAIMIAGGLFLLVSTTLEIHNKLEGDEEETENVTLKKSFIGIVQKIVVLDLVFSFDSIITAIGMAESVWIQLISVMVAMLIMVLFAGKISKFIAKHPTFKLLALSFLILIGFTLIVDGVHIDAFKVPHGYIYFAMAFSFGVELLNLQVRKKSKKVIKLQEPVALDTKSEVIDNL
jgi:predicted tellurium resistance membrane protein TerC